MRIPINLYFKVAEPFNVLSLGGTLDIPYVNDTGALATCFASDSTMATNIEVKNDVITVTFSDFESEDQLTRSCTLVLSAGGSKTSLTVKLTSHFTLLSIVPDLLTERYFDKYDRAALYNVDFSSASVKNYQGISAPWGVWQTTRGTFKTALLTWEDNPTGNDVILKNIVPRRTSRVWTSVDPVNAYLLVTKSGTLRKYHYQGSLQALETLVQSHSGASNLDLVILGHPDALIRCGFYDFLLDATIGQDLDLEFVPNASSVDYTATVTLSDSTGSRALTINLAANTTAPSMTFSENDVLIPNYVNSASYVTVKEIIVSGLPEGWDWEIGPYASTVGLEVAKVGNTVVIRQNQQKYELLNVFYDTIPIEGFQVGNEANSFTRYINFYQDLYTKFDYTPKTVIFDANGKANVEVIQLANGSNERFVPIPAIVVPDWLNGAFSFNYGTMLVLVGNIQPNDNQGVRRATANIRVALKDPYGYIGSGLYAEFPVDVTQYSLYDFIESPLWSDVEYVPSSEASNLTVTKDDETVFTGILSGHPVKANKFAEDFIDIDKNPFRAFLTNQNSYVTLTLDDNDGNPEEYRFYWNWTYGERLHRGDGTYLDEHPFLLTTFPSMEVTPGLYVLASVHDYASGTSHAAVTIYQQSTTPHSITIDGDSVNMDTVTAAFPTTPDTTRVAIVCDEFEDLVLNFKVTCNHRYVTYYLNRAGGWCWMNWDGKILRTDTVKPQSYLTNYNTNAPMEFETVHYQKDITQQYELTSGYLTDAQSEALAEIIYSPVVYLHDILTDTVYAVNVDTTTFLHKTFKNQGRKFFTHSIKVTNAQKHKVYI